MIVADTDVLIDSMHGKEPSLGRIEVELSSGQLATTAITAFELWSGVRTARQADRVRDLLAAMTVLPFDEEAGVRAGILRRELEAAGQGIGTADYLVAAVCLTRSAMLLTRNRAHFERVRDLSLATLS